MTVEPRLYLDAPFSAGAQLDLDKDQAHYLVNVMRRSAGDTLRVFNGRDGEWRAEIAEAGKRRASLQLLEQTRAQTAAPDLHLFFSPVKKARTDFIVEKATELGASAITPVMTRRTMADRVRTDRLSALVREAAEQTERLDLPQVGEPVSLTQMLKGWDADRLLIFCDEAGDDDDAPWGGEAGRAAPIFEALAPFAPPPTPALPQGGGRDAPTAQHDAGRFRVSDDGMFLEDTHNAPPSPSGEGRGGGRPTPNAKALAQARRMRKEPTPAETKLWTLLKDLKEPGAHFRRQTPIGPYVADFACLSKRLIVEADGGGHGGMRDLARDAWLETHGYRVLRFWNNEILENPGGVFEAVQAAMSHPTPTLPQGGGRDAAAQSLKSQNDENASPPTNLYEQSNSPPSPSGGEAAKSGPGDRTTGRTGGVTGKKEKWAILIGPEGGFDPEERQLLRGQSFVVPVTLGPRILRADTAVAAAMSVWQAVLGDWNLS